MNNVDYLLRVQFSTLWLEEKLEIKRFDRPDDLTNVLQTRRLDPAAAWSESDSNFLDGMV